jgi:hypothetical protein
MTTIDEKVHYLRDRGIENIPPEALGRLLTDKNLPNNIANEIIEFLTDQNSIEEFEGPNKPVFYSDLNDEDMQKNEKWEEAPIGLNKLDGIFKFPVGYYIICANPGAGKGFFATWLTRRFYEQHGITSAYFSLEMSESMIRKRLKQSWSDITQVEFDSGHSTQKAISLMKKNIIAVYPFGESDQSYQTPENFKKDIQKFYELGYRVFHFDHLHELDGANTNDTNQRVIEVWGKVFQDVCKQYEDIWLFVYAQPNGAAASKSLIKRTDVAGSKSITQKCEFFLSLNRVTNEDKDTGEVKVEEENREVILYLDKSRKSSKQHIGCKLYFGEDGNYYENKDQYNQKTFNLADEYSEAIGIFD